MKKILLTVLILGITSCKKNPEKFINDNDESGSVQKEKAASE